jgi:hypothetical protein
MVLAGFLTLMVGNCLVSSMAFAGEFRFMVHDVRDDAVAWSPSEVIIHTGTDIDGD